MAELFGFRIERSKKDQGAGTSFSTPTPDDGTIDVAGGGFFGQILDVDGREKTELDLIRRYRDISTQSSLQIKRIRRLRLTLIVFRIRIKSNAK